MLDQANKTMLLLASYNNKGKVKLETFPGVLPLAVLDQGSEPRAAGSLGSNYATIVSTTTLKVTHKEHAPRQVRQGQAPSQLVHSGHARRPCIRGLWVFFASCTQQLAKPHPQRCSRHECSLTIWMDACCHMCAR